METTLLTRRHRAALSLPGPRAQESAPQVQATTKPLRFWHRARKAFWASLLASLLLHSATIGVVYWLSVFSSWLPAKPWEVAPGRASVSLTASLASIDASAAQNEVTESFAVVRGELTEARIEQPAGSPEPRTEPASRQPTFDLHRVAQQLALPDVKRDDALELIELQPTVGLGARARGEAVLEMVPDTVQASTSTPRSFATAEIDSTASLSSPAYQASTGADGDQAASVIFNPAPRYPPAALAARQTGRVLLRVTVATSGTVLKASILRTSGVPALDAAALEAVQQWRFQPAVQAGVPVEKEIAVPIRFALAGGS